MQYKYYFTLLASILLFISSLSAQEEWIGCHSLAGKKLKAPTPAQRAAMAQGLARSDTFDIVHYTIDLDVTDFAGKQLKGHCEVSFSPKMNNIDRLNFDLLNFQIDSILDINGDPINYQYDSLLLTLQFDEPIPMSDTASVHVYYHGSPTPDPDWGGFIFEDGYAYNLGIGITSNPPNYGRGWYPCFDNFVERSTYEYRVMSSKGRRAFCVGTLIREDSVGGDSIIRTYRMDQQIPTYLSNVAVSNYSAVDIMHDGIFGPVPIQLVAKTPDTNRIKSSLIYMADAVDALEFWFGPYVWDRVGYISTSVGAMEHPTNVAYPDAILDGIPANNNRLMAHELGHHWWGNITTLREPHDMWIKEGPAEYSAHLFQEWVFGKNAFKKTVMDNLEYVLENAHLHDEGYRALSPMPFQFIYGTHTYRKGALVMHNLRAYLGDTLFSQAMQSILETFPYDAIDAQMFRDQLSTASGINMEPYFDAWIFNPGYSTFHIESMQDINPAPDVIDLELTVRQGLHHAPDFHNAVPLNIALYNSDWEKEIRSILVSGEKSTVVVEDVSWLPEMIALNEENTINLATMHGNEVISESGFQAIPYADFIFNVQDISDSTLVRVEHYWDGPDDSMRSDEVKAVSSTHFWRVDWLAAGNFEAGGRIEYNGGSPDEFDYDITGVSEDSLILAWRPDALSDWVEHPEYRQFKLSPSDGRGFVLIDALLPGDYAFAKRGEVTTSVDSQADLSVFSLFPNPTSGLLRLQGELYSMSNSRIEARVLDMEGQYIWSKILNPQDIDLNQSIYIDDRHPSGIYLLELREQNGDILFAEMFELVR